MSAAAAEEAARAQQQAVEARAELAAAVDQSQQQVKAAHEVRTLAERFAALFRGSVTPCDAPYELTFSLLCLTARAGRRCGGGQAD